MSSIQATGTAYVPPSSLIQTTQALQQPAVSNAGGDGDGGARVHRGGRGGQMQQAMLQALQSLGLSLPQQTATAGSAQTASGSPDNDGDTDGSTSATGNVKNDLRQFMHALFQAVKKESSTASAAAGTTGSSNDPKTNFSAGLSALISQASSGTAPSHLKDAFAQLMSDLQPSGAASSGAANSGGTAGASTTSPQTTLQALLAQLQQNLGYGGSNLAATGNVVNAVV